MNILETKRRERVCMLMSLWQPKSGKPKRQILRRAYKNKIWAAFRVETGRTRAEVGAELGVAESTLRGWIHERDIKDHAVSLDGAINLSLLELSPRFCENAIYNPDDLLKNVFDRAAGLNRFNKGSTPLLEPGSCSSAASSAPGTPSTSSSDSLICQGPEVSFSRKRLHSEGYNTDGSSSADHRYHRQLNIIRR